MYLAYHSQIHLDLTRYTSVIFHKDTYTSISCEVKRFKMVFNPLQHAIGHNVPV